MKSAVLEKPVATGALDADRLRALRAGAHRLRR